MDAWLYSASDRATPLAKTLATVLLAAAAVGLLLQLADGWIAVCGTSAQSSCALCLAAALGAAAASMIFRRFSFGIPQILIAAGTAILSTWICPDIIEYGFQWAIDSGLPHSVTWFAAAVPVAAITTTSFMLLNEAASQSRTHVLSSVAAGSIAFAAHAWLSTPYALTVTLVAIAGSLAVVSGRAMSGRTWSANPGDDDSWKRATILNAFLNLAAGVTLASGWMILDRVFSVTMMSVACGTAGTAVLLLVLNLRPLKLIPFPSLTFLGSILMMVACFMFFDALVDASLELNATTLSGLKIIVAQGMQLAVWSTLVLVTLMAAAKTADLRKRVESSLMPAGLLTGIGLTWLFSGVTLHPAIPAMIGMAVLTIPAVRSVWHRSTVPRWRGIVTGGIALTAITVAAIHPPNLSRPSRLLFTARAQAAVHRNIDRDMIPLTDATRLVDTIDTLGATLTQWSTRGNEHEWRNNGLLVDSTSADIQVAPQPPASVLTAVLPLVTHPRPGSVLILDDHCGLVLSTCQDFPLHTIHAVKPDTSALRWLTTDSQNHVSFNSDDRTTIAESSVEVAIRRPGSQTFDVVISALADPLSADATSRVTQSFYRAASDRLADDGVFCQHIRQAQIAGDSVLQILGTVSSVFQQTAVIQLVPGELAVLASNSKTPLMDKELLKRLERSHVRRQLARCGWDWCQVAALPVVDSNDPIGLWEHREMPRPASARSGRFGLRLGWEVVRPMNRAESLHQLLAPHQRRMAEAVPRSEAHEEFRRRMSAYAQQQEVLTAFPDEPWTYRRSLKSEMQRNARPPMEVVRNGNIQRLPHPLDEARKNYVTTLGELLQQTSAGQVRAEDLRKLTDSTRGYEPLISDFAHYELVRIHELAGHPSPADEFRHRLHTVYFSPARDSSVRNVVAALDQLLEQPALVPNDRERFDHLNGLVQELIGRWETRRGIEPRSARRTQRDVELSLQATRAALESLRKLASGAGLSPEEMALRRRFVARALVVPLRDYRDTVLAHRAKHEPTLLTDSDDPGDLPLLMPDLTN